MDHIVTIPHLFDWSGRASFLKAVREVGPDTRLILDFSSTSKIKAIGLALLLQLVERFENPRDMIYIVRAEGSVLRLLQAVGLDSRVSMGYPE